MNTTVRCCDQGCGYKLPDEYADNETTCGACLADAVESIEMVTEPNGDVTIHVYGLKRFTVEHTPEGFECALWSEAGQEYWITTLDEDMTV
jgi:hypothetical protein